MNAMDRVKRKLEDLECIYTTCFNLCILVKVKENVKCFFRN